MLLDQRVSSGVLGFGRFKLHAVALHGTRGVWQPRVVHLVETSYIERGAGPVVVTGSRINDKNSYSPAIRNENFE